MSKRVEVSPEVKVLCEELSRELTNILDRYEWGNVAYWGSVSPSQSEGRRLEITLRVGGEEECKHCQECTCPNCNCSMSHRGGTFFYDVYYCKYVTFKEQEPRIRAQFAKSMQKFLAKWDPSLPLTDCWLSAGYEQ